MKQIKAKLGLGPMSTEAIEAIFRYSHYNRCQLMIIASKNQIDYKGGYVNKWTTKQFMDFIKEIRSKYNFSEVLICRDHCGPGFNGIDDLQDTYKTIETDIKEGFDLIHIDFCHFKGDREQRLEETKKAIEFCLKLKPDIAIEIGTDENIGAKFNINELSFIEEEINYFKKISNPTFFVVQTGSLVREINQVGGFNLDFVKKISDLIHKHNLKLKEHNADYLSKEEIMKRKDIVDALNIAPQLGVIQTSLIINKCLVYGVSELNNFIELVYNGNKWKKWLHTNTPENKLLCVMCAGHYHFASIEYKKIIEKLGEYEDINESIITAIMEVIGHYERSN